MLNVGIVAYSAPVFHGSVFFIKGKQYALYRFVYSYYLFAVLCYLLFGEGKAFRKLIHTGGYEVFLMRYMFYRITLHADVIQPARRERCDGAFQGGIAVVFPLT